jgi:vesicle-fusing ATPase
LTFSFDLLGKVGVKIEFNHDTLGNSVKLQFLNQVFALRQQFVIDVSGVKLDVVVESMERADISGSGSVDVTSGQLSTPTEVRWKKSGSAQNSITIIGGNTMMKNDSMFKKDFNFEKLGIGGLDEQFKKMFRTAFASRLFPGIVKQFGINHIRGILLFGPPGKIRFVVQILYCFDQLS